MQAFAPTGPQNGKVAEVPGPTGAIKLSPEMNFVEYAFADETKGWLFEGTETEKLTLPANTGAFYLYAGWGCANCGGPGSDNNPGTVSVTAVTQDGTSSGAVTVPERPSGEYFGFYAECGSSLQTLALTITGSSSTPPLAIGAFAIAPTSANTKCPTAAAPVAESSKEESEQEAQSKIEGCPVGTTPVNSLTTPVPPQVEAEASAFTHIRISGVPTPTVEPPQYCQYRAKYTQAEKEAAHQWYLFYNEEAANGTIAAASLGTLAGALTAVPEPTLSKGGALALGVIAGLVGVTTGYLNKQANLMSSIEHDPADPNWPTVAASPQTYPGKLSKVPGLRRRQQKAIDAYATALISQYANMECEIESINRASTALAHKNAATAAAQYKAGAACAAANAGIAKQLPSLSKKAKPAVAALLKVLKRAPVKRYLAKHFSADVHNQAFRAKAAAKTVAELKRTIALPSSATAELEAALAKQQPESVIGASKLLRAAFPAAKVDAKWRTLQEQTAQVLAAAAAK